MTDLVWLALQNGSGHGPFYAIARFQTSGAPDATPWFSDPSISSSPNGPMGLVMNGTTPEVWFSNGSTDVLRFGTNDALLGDIVDATNFNFPGQPCQMGTGEVWIGSGNVSPLPNILRFNADGTPYAGGHLVVDANLGAAGACIGPDGAVWVANDNTGDYIYRFNADGTPYAGGNLNPAGRTGGAANALCTVGSVVWAPGYNGAAFTLDVIDTSGTITSSIVFPAGYGCECVTAVGAEVWAAVLHFSGGLAAFIYRYDTSGTLLGTITPPLSAALGLGLCVAPYGAGPIIVSKPVGWFFTPVLGTPLPPLCIDAVAATGQITAATDLPFGSGDFTIGGWVRTTRDNISPTTICAVGMASPYDTYLLIEVSPAGPGNTYVDVQVAQAGHGSFVDTGGSNPLGPAVGPHLVVVTRAGTTLTLYVDGAAFTTTIGAGSINQSGGQTYFSAPPGPGIPVAPGGYNWDGYMWYWGAWVGTAVSGTDIAAWYAGGTSAALPGTPTHQWLMNEGHGLILHDTVGSDDVSSPGGFTWAARP